MTPLQNKIQTNFNTASLSYDSVSTIQKQSGEFLVGKLENFKDFSPKTILDLGTGTGYIPELLLKNYPNSTYYLNDIAFEMLKKCKVKFSGYANMHYLHGDMQNLSSNTFDLVISNLALQWVNNLWTTLEMFHSRSSQIFGFSTLLDGTFIEWKKLINQYQNIKLHNYPSARELVQFCKKLNRNDAFDYWIVDIPLSFDNPFTFMRYLKALGALASHHPMDVHNLRALLKEHTTTFSVSYKLFFGIFKKG